ncbi:MAG: hypothetical protein IJ328_06600 [Muribaculaceae bacterium]|nr:hypothetical protein [Muribaculaceae bacterium]
MKRIIISTLFLVVIVCRGYSQQECSIPMMVLLSEQEGDMSAKVCSSLESKLRAMVTKNGMEGGAKFSSFSLVVSISENSREIITGMKPMVAVSLDVELFVGNNYTGDKFTSKIITLSGAGKNDERAYTSAFNSLSKDKTDIENFLKETKSKIELYYDTQAQNIVKQAKAYSLKHEYEEAFCLLSSVPACSKDYNLVEKCMYEIFQEYVDYDCAVKIAKAKSVWNASQDKEGALLAGAYLSSIDPASSCWSDVMDLAESIRARIGDEWNFSKEIQRETIKQQNLKIETIKAIGIAYGENQKATTINEHWLVR